MAKKLLSLFWECLKISLFVIGGGYAIIIVADEVFSRKGWIRVGELVDRLPIFQTIPGLIATHTAVYVGDRLAGGLGAFVGVLGMAIPSVAIFTFVSMGYSLLPLDSPLLASAFLGLRSGLVGIIAAAIASDAASIHLAIPISFLSYNPQEIEGILYQNNQFMAQKNHQKVDEAV